MNLFEEKYRDDLKPANHLDNTFDFFNRSSRDSSKQIRDILNKWFYNYPNSEKKEFLNRVKIDFQSAFYELFIHELFTSLGYELLAHPVLNNSKDKPDFFAKKGEEEFYIEAKVATDISHEETAHNNRLNRLLDIINKTNSPNYFLELNEVLFKKKEQPKGRNIVSFIENRIQTFEDKNSISTNELTFDYPQFVYEDEIVKVIFSLIRKSEKIRGKSGIRPIGIYPSSHAMWGGADDSIKTAFKKKVKKYGNLDKPLLLCINSLSLKGVDKIDILNAFFGSEQISWSTDPSNRDEKFSRAFDGLFSDKKGSKNTKISGILVTKVYCTNLETTPHWFIEHPFAKLPLKSDFEIFDKIAVRDNRIKEFPGTSIKDILNIPNGWLRNI